MALKVNPEVDGNEFEGVSEGRKLVHGVGLNRWTAGTGTPMMSVGFVVLRDPKGKDVGKIVMERFAVTAKALFRIARWALASGHTAEFDAEDDEDIKKIMSHGPLVASMVLGSEYKGKRKVEVEKFAPYSGQHDPAWDALIEEGEEEYERIMLRMEDARAKRETGSSAASTGGYGGGGGGRPNPPVDQYDDIPF